MEKLLDKITGWGFDLKVKLGTSIAYTRGEFLLTINFSSMFVVLDRNEPTGTTVSLFTYFLKDANYDEIISQIERIISIQED